MDFSVFLQTTSVFPHSTIMPKRVKSSASRVVSWPKWTLKLVFWPLTLLGAFDDAEEAANPIVHRVLLQSAFVDSTANPTAALVVEVQNRFVPVGRIL